MFSETLSTTVLRLCELHKLSFESAAERCGISSKHYGSIAKMKTTPSILVLEKICNGFQLTPNDLLISPSLRQQMGFRLPMTVTHVQKVPYQNGFTTYPICPRCGISFEREYQRFCDRCGQCLQWKGFWKAKIIKQPDVSKTMGSGRGKDMIFYNEPPPHGRDGIQDAF